MTKKTLFRKKGRGYISKWERSGEIEGDSFRTEIRRFGEEEDGIGVVEVILILVVLIGLIVIFKSQLTELINDTFDNITDKAGTL